MAPRVSVDAPPVPGSFVVNIGDMFETWTNGEFVAGDRIACAAFVSRALFFSFFLRLRAMTVVRGTAATICWTGQTTRYPPLKAGSHWFAQTRFRASVTSSSGLPQGESTLPSPVRPRISSSFGQEARHKSAEGTGQP